MTLDATHWALLASTILTFVYIAKKVRVLKYQEEYFDTDSTISESSRSIDASLSSESFSSQRSEWSINSEMMSNGRAASSMDEYVNRDYIGDQYYDSNLYWSAPPQNNPCHCNCMYEGDQNYGRVRRYSRQRSPGGKSSDYDYEQGSSSERIMAYNQNPDSLIVENDETLERVPSRAVESKRGYTVIPNMGPVHPQQYSGSGTGASESGDDSQQLAQVFNTYYHDINRRLSGTIDQIKYIQDYLSYMRQHIRKSRSDYR